MKTKQEILEAAIQKAIAGGWADIFNGGYEKWEWQPEFTRWDNGEIYEDNERIDLEVVIFNHDFAKALWGEEDEIPYRIGSDMDSTWVAYGKVVTDPAWMYHLQHMVIADDPIQYLGEHL